jgi:FKBP-type peptidyl-prolyl cis-trans isomerase FkpA
VFATTMTVSISVLARSVALALPFAVALCGSSPASAQTAPSAQAVASTTSAPAAAPKASASKAKPSKAKASAPAAPASARASAPARSASEIAAAARAAIEKKDPTPQPAPPLPEQRAVTQPLLQIALQSREKPTQPPAADAKPLALPEGRKGESTDGFVIVHRAEGTGVRPTSVDFIRMNYTAMFVDGSVIASSMDKEPHTIFNAQGLPCWNRAFQQMQVGGKATVICPPAMAWGATGFRGVVPPNTSVRFDLELLDVLR